MLHECMPILVVHDCSSSSAARAIGRQDLISVNEVLITFYDVMELDEARGGRVLDDIDVTEYFHLLCDLEGRYGRSLLDIEYALVIAVDDQLWKLNSVASRFPD